MAKMTNVFAETLKDEFVQRSVGANIMSLSLDTKEQVLEAAINGLSRVAEASCATPTEKRTQALDAAANRYRQTAQDLGYDEAEIQEWLHGIMSHLRTEVAARELAQQKNERHDDDAHRWCLRPFLKISKKTACAV
jgi:hypothetical protein